MTSPRGPVSAALTARVVHGALFIGTAVATTVLVWLRANAAIEVVDLGAGAAVVRALVLVVAGGGTVGLRILRSALPAAPAAPASTGLDAWWQANLGRAVALWAFPDGVGVAGAVAYLLTGDALVVALAAGWAFAMFVAYAPGRLASA